ncbi:MAG: hypothetical protein C4290_03865 [Chloroflexota bacterium]
MPRCVTPCSARVGLRGGCGEFQGGGDVTQQERSAAAVVAGLAATLDATQPLPLYEQIAQGLQRAVQSGALPPGTSLPPEPELARRLGVSRQTVHQALSRLARRGVLTRRRGVGTFVAEPFIEQPLGGLYSFVRTLAAQGRQPGTHLLGQRLTVDERASTLLSGAPDALVYELSRLRLVDGEPFVLETVYLPAACVDRLPREALAEAPLYELLRRYCGVTVTHAEETLQPVTLTRAQAALLGLPAGAPAFLVERIGFAGEQAVELRVSLIRGDRYRFRVRLEGPDLAAGQE